LSRVLVLAALAGLLLSPDRTLITKKGEVLRGKVVESSGEYVVETPGGDPRRIPLDQVGVVYEDPHEVILQVEERFTQAKRHYAEAEKLDADNRARNEKLQLAIDVAQGAANLCRWVEPQGPPDVSSSMGRTLQLLLQFIRLCRGASTSEIARAPGSGTSGEIPLSAARFAFEAPPAPGRPWILADELGPGLGAIAQELLNPDPAKRLEAVRRLTHPPVSSQAPALLKALEAEKSPEVLSALAEGLSLLEAGPLLKSLGWARHDADPLRRSIAMSIARTAGDRSALDFLLDWFADSPPQTHPDRAAFASAFRQLRAGAVPLIKELLTKQRQPKLQVEILRQMGGIGDKAFAPMLLRALATYPRDAFVSLQRIGKPAVPVLVEGCHSEQQDIRKLSLALCRKLTGLTSLNAGTFEAWWGENKKAVLEEEKVWWEEQARTNFATPPAVFAPYDQPLEALVR
jgi:hypothetical protein